MRITDRAAKSILACGIIFFAGCSTNNTNVKIDEVRRSSIAAMISGSADNRKNSSEIESLIGINHVVREPVIGNDDFHPSDVAEIITPKNILGAGIEGEVDTLRGSVSGPSESFHALPPRQNAVFHIAFRREQSALVMISSTAGKMTLRVTDPISGSRCRDSIRRGVAICRMVTNKTTKLAIQVSNENEKRVVYSLLVN